MIAATGLRRSHGTGLTCTTLLCALALTGCGFGTGAAQPSANGNVAGQAAAIRLISPADLDADNLVDAVPHPGMRRIVLQAPEGTPIRITRGGADLPFENTRLAVPGGTINEIALLEPLGTSTVTLTAGPYSVMLQPNAELAAGQRLSVRPAAKGALANDVVNAAGAVFESPDDVALLVSGILPPLIGPGLFLQSGHGAQVQLNATLTRAGVTLTPQSRLLPDHVYTLRCAPGVVDALGNTPEPQFKLTCRYGRGAAAIRTVLADVDRDNNPDLVCLFADGSVSLLRDPAGLSESLLPPSAGRGIDIAAGDFDGNGAADLAVLRAGENGFQLTWMLNETRKGEPQFQMTTDAPAFEQPAAMRAADIDRDARDDLAILDAFGTVHILTRSAKRSFSVTGSRQLCTRLCVCDASGDGKPDICVLAADGALHVAYNRGPTGFGEGAAAELTVEGAQRLHAGLLDGDRAVDFAFTGMAGVRTWTGGTSEPLALAIEAVEKPALVSGAALARDVNRDSRADVIAAREDSRGMCEDLAVFLNGDEAAPVPDAVLPLGVKMRIHALELWREYLVMATDSKLVLLKVNTEALPPTVASAVRFIEGYAPVPQIPAPLSAAVADYNDDGKADIAALDKDGKLRIYLSGEPGQPFAAVAEPVALGGAGMLKAIDFDRDGAPDLLFIPTDPGLRPRVLRNTRRGEMDTNDNGLLPEPPTMLRGAPALGDFDRDGDLDVLWPCPHGRVQFAEGGRWRDGRATVEVREPGGARLQFAGELACADFTGDGIADVAAVMQLSEDGAGGHFLVLLQGTGFGEDGQACFRAFLSEQVRGRIFKLTPADFDGDGRIDLAIGLAPENTQARLQLLRLGEGAQFTPFEGSPRAKGRLLDLALDDLDRDGDYDLIASEEVAGRVVTTLWVNNGRGFYGEGGFADDSLQKALGDFRATNLSLADFTGDGRADLLAADPQGNVTLVQSYLP